MVDVRERLTHFYLSQSDFIGVERWAEPVLTFRDPPSKDGLGLDDLLVALERDVTTDHVKEQNPQRPDGERDRFVGLRQNPLRRTVDPGT